MKPQYSIRNCLLAAGMISAAGFAYGQTTDITWTANNGDLLTAANWDLNRVPGVSDVVIINNGGTAIIGTDGVIGTDPGTFSLAGIKLGSIEGGTESGHIIMNSGTLHLGGTAGDPKAVIGFSSVLSRFIMNGGTIYFDGPDQFPGSRGDDGLNGLDWEVGEKGLGRFEMHGTAKFFAGDDLKVGANPLGRGTVLIDGNAHFAAGSGLSVSEGGPSEEQLMTIAGNAVVDLGNSMGAGNPLGSTDEGYLTMASGGAGSTGRLIVQDNAVINYRRLSAREGTSTIIVKNNAQMHIFDVLVGKGALGVAPSADRPAETGPNSTLASAASNTDGVPHVSTLTLQDDAVMTVNSDPAGGPTKGLGISAPRDSGNAGGTAALIIRDRAAFRVEQNLGVGTGAADTSDGTLTVVGPSAAVTINGDLQLAVDLEGTATPGKGTVNPVITAATHTIINVNGIAKLANGTLKVKLDGFAPAAGASYTIIKGGTIEGQFKATDFSEAPLAGGLAWNVEYTTDSVLLKVATPPPWRLIAISGQQGNADDLNPQGGFLYPDNTLFEVNLTSGALTKLFRTTWVPDSQAIGFNPADGLLYHTAGANAYRNDPLRAGHEQGGPDIPGVGYQDSYYLEKINLTTQAATAIFNADPCPNPDPTLPCFGLPAPIPTWAEPQLRRDSTQTGNEFRLRGENEYTAARGLAWSTAKQLFYLSDGEGIFKLTASGDSTFLARPAFADAKADECKGIAFITTNGVTKLLVGHRNAGAIMEVDAETGEPVSELALTYPAGGGEPTDGFGGVLGLAQHPSTGVVYAIRKTSDNFARELVTVNLATGETTLVGSMAMHVSDIVFVGQATTGSPTISIVRNTDGSATITFTGTLEAADTVNGTYSPVAGATSPLPVTPAAGASAKFYRSRN